MDVDKRILKQTVDNIKRELDQLYNEAIDTLDQMANAEDVETVMSLKKKLLLLWLDQLPIFSSHCYFCEKLRMNCDSCSYAKYHGECGSEYVDDMCYGIMKTLEEYAEHYDISDWAKIKAVYDVLMTLIEEEYYYGETYD